MKYWDDFQTKWGFGDGDAMPPDAWACRAVYIREINRLARKKRSKVRLAAFDRPGMHNCYLIVTVPARAVAKVPLQKLCCGQWKKGWDCPADLPDQDNDDAMLAAIQEAFEANLDNLVETKVRIRVAKNAHNRKAFT